MTVEDLLDRISSPELSEWMAFEQIEGPIGSPRADLHAGIIASVIANGYRDKKTKRSPFKPSDFIPKWDQGAGGPDPDELAAKARVLNAMMGGTEGGGG